MTYYINNDDNDNNNHVYHESIIVKCRKLNDSIQRLYTEIKTEITVNNHRTSEGVILDKIEDSISDNIKCSFYNDKMNQIHNNTNSSSIKTILKTLYNMKKLFINYNNSFSSPSSSSYSRNNNEIDYLQESDEFIDETKVEYEITDTMESNIKIAVLNERNRWLDYLLSNVLIDKKGDNVIVIKNVKLIEKSKQEVKVKIEENTNILSFSSQKPTSLSVSSNKLLLSS